MKIGILTFHDGINYGAFMQAYSLQEKLKSLGHEVEIINYKKLSFAIREELHFLLRKGKILKNIKKIWKFREIHKNFNQTKYVTNVSIFDDRYDFVFFGSDEVWNVNNAGFGYDPTYFGKGLENTKKISYAPSFGSTQIGDQKLERIKNYLEDFSSISVRDLNSQAVVENMVGTKPVIVPDPTFLVDHKKWLIEPEIDDYILVYASLLKDEHIEYIKSTAKRLNKKLVAVGIYQSWCDYNFLVVDPFEWIGFFKKADFVFTSMFHGTIFSILMRSSFTIFMDPYRLNKFSYLLKFLSFEDRVFDPSLRSDSISHINYETKEELIAKYSDLGSEYIESSLS